MLQPGKPFQQQKLSAYTDIPLSLKENLEIWNEKPDKLLISENKCFEKYGSIFPPSLDCI
jgi:hypothetical protein